MGAKKYNLIDNYNLTGSVVEIGTERGEGSTDYLSKACKKTGNKFYTIDFDINVPRFKDAEQYFMTGEKFFDSVFPEDEKICFAYLDGFDWIWEPEEEVQPLWITEQIDYYKTYGIEMNNDNSQLSHLNITKEVEKHAADKCIILFDDTFHTGSHYDGKGGTACHWLLARSKRWYKIHMEGNGAHAFCNWI